MYDMAGMMRGVIFSCIVFAGAVAAGIAAFQIQARCLVYITVHFHLMELFYDADAQLFDFSPAVLLLPCIVAYGIQKKITKLLTWFNDHVHISWAFLAAAFAAAFFIVARIFIVWYNTYIVYFVISLGIPDVVRYEWRGILYLYDLIKRVALYHALFLFQKIKF